jgi:NAD(P)-dependent dehydrogenase (short-subunit alcohol dehydrogenase family)
MSCHRRCLLLFSLCPSSWNCYCPLSHIILFCFAPFISCFSSTLISSVLLASLHLSSFYCVLRYAAYGATKRAMPQLTTSLNKELSDLNLLGCVGVHNLSPGMVRLSKPNNLSYAEVLKAELCWATQHNTTLHQPIWTDKCRYSFPGKKLI